MQQRCNSVRRLQYKAKRVGNLPPCVTLAHVHSSNVMGGWAAVNTHRNCVPGGRLYRGVKRDALCPFWPDLAHLLPCSPKGDE